MPFGSGGDESHDISVAQIDLRLRGYTLPAFRATASGFLSFAKSGITTSSRLIACRPGGPIGYGWCARMSNFAGLRRQFLARSRAVPETHRSSRTKRAGGMRAPPGLGSPNGAVPAVRIFVP